MHAIPFRHRSRRLFRIQLSPQWRQDIDALQRLGIVSLVMAAAITAISGCQGYRLQSPLASQRTIDNSSPSIHGPSMAGSAEGQAAPKSGSRVQVTSENAFPETEIEPVDQRLATPRQVARRTATPPAHTRQTMSELAGDTGHQSAADSKPARQNPPRQNSAQSNEPTGKPTGEIAQVSASLPVEPAMESSLESALALSLDLPQNYSGVDITDLIAALEGAPPEIQRAAVIKLVASAQSRACATAQPKSIDAALSAAFDHLPDLPTVVPERDVKPTRIGTSQPPTAANIATTKPAGSLNNVTHAAVQAALQSGPAIQQTSLETPQQTLIELKLDDAPTTFANASKPQPPVASEPQRMTFSDQAEPVPSVSMSLSDSPPATNDISPAPIAGAKAGAATLSDAELFDALVARLQKETPGESDAERHRRRIVARHLLVLSGDPDRAVDHLEGLSEEEAQYLRHQLLGLWKIVDPKGHPVPSHRFSSALPEIRKATGYLAAASDSLEVRGLEFCTEIEAYGQVKPFPNRRFAAGQEVILYCEIDNFVTSSVDGGFETRLRGSYDLLDASGQRIASQTLPEDRQVSNNHLRDYFIAYQMYLPEAIDPGRYQLRLTMEDIHGKKYGQSTVDFEIKRE